MPVVPDEMRQSGLLKAFPGSRKHYGGWQALGQIKHLVTIPAINRDYSNKEGDKDKRVLNNHAFLAVVSKAQHRRVRLTLQVGEDTSVLQNYG